MMDYNVNKINEVHSDVLSFVHLKKNWDGYKAVPTENKSIVNTLSIISILGPDIICEICDLFPNPHGTITIEWKNNNKLLSLEIGNNSFSFYKDIKKSDVEHFDNLKINNDSIEILISKIIQII